MKKRISSKLKSFREFAAVSHTGKKYFPSLPKEYHSPFHLFIETAFIVGILILLLTFYIGISLTKSFSHLIGKLSEGF